MEKIIQGMKQLGFTEYEVKAYLSLINQFPQNGYSLSKSSGIPRSRIYEVLDGLKKKQVVFEGKVEKGAIYTPLEPEFLLEKIKQEFKQVMKEVESYTFDVYKDEAKDLEPRILRGRKEILEMVKVLINQAQKRIAFSIWHDELVELKEEIDEAIDRGVIVKGMYFGMLNPYDELVAHRRMERYIAENAERYLIVVIDDQHVISGVISRGEETDVSWSMDKGIIRINDDFIAHDLMLNTYSNFLEGQDLVDYERKLDQVRKEYHGLSDEEFEALPYPKDYKPKL